MTTQELHIELDVLLQRVNSHWNQNFLPQEKDLFLNREITRFIDRRIDRLGNKKREGLFDTIKRTVELSPLINTVRLPVINDTIKKEVSVLLPFDFMYYISSELSVCCSCRGLPLINAMYYEAELSPLKNLSALPLTVTQGLFSFTIQPSDIPSDYLIANTVPVYNDTMMLQQALAILFQEKNNLEIDIKYDKTRKVFVFRSNSFFSIRSTTSSGFTATQVKAIPYKRYEDIKDGLLSAVDVIDEEFAPKIKNSYLSGAKDEKSLVRLRKDRLSYTVKGVIADYAYLTYLKKPKKIDLLLQSNSELSEVTLEKVASDTAQRIMGVISSDNYAKFVEENSLVE